MVKENWVFLCGVNQDQEADIIVALLNQENIPTLKQYPEAGGFLKIAYGLTAGVDLYVPGLLREKALELVQESLSIPEEDVDEQENLLLQEGEMEQENPPSNSANSFKMVLWGVLLGVLLLMVAHVLNR